ncbi:MAG: hypothetical protein R3321_03655 [Nitrososphaeraceae archaeon]|nr:hypothetical protein [Nitrososphaeraceae archaeon]
MGIRPVEIGFADIFQLDNARLSQIDLQKRENLTLRICDIPSQCILENQMTMQLISSIARDYDISIQFLSTSVPFDAYAVTIWCYSINLY